MIDLDRPARPTVKRAGPRAMLAALALIMVGAVIGGVVAYRWQQKQVDDARRSAVSLLLLPDGYEWPDDEVSPLRGAGRQQANSVVLGRHVNLINSGPAPVRFRSFQIDRTGLQLRGEPEGGTDVLIQPGGDARAAIHATVRCNTDPLTQPQPVTVEIVTADGVARQPTITFDGRTWAASVEQACAQPFSRSLAGR